MRPRNTIVLTKHERERLAKIRVLVAMMAVAAGPTARDWDVAFLLQIVDRLAPPQ